MPNNPEMFERTLRELSEARRDNTSWRSTFAHILGSIDVDLCDDYEDEPELRQGMAWGTWTNLVSTAPWRDDDYFAERYAWAIDCAIRLTSCAECDRETLAPQYIEGGTRVCASCIEECFPCPNCGSVWRFEGDADECCRGMDEDEDEETGCDCPSCRGSSSSYGRRTIRSYNYKPEPIMHGAERFRFGIELEMEAGRQVDRETLAHAIADESEEDYYLKDDGSLNNGVELVSHPRSLDSWKEYASELERVLGVAASNGAKAWDASTCGLHVHVSRTAFLTESHLYRFCLLIESNPEPLSRFAGRRSEQWASFDKGKRGVELIDAVKPYVRGDRYMAVNLNNEHTVELRFFRPSLKVRSVIGAVELLHAMIEYTRDLDSDDVIIKQALTWLKFAPWIVQHKETYPAAVDIMGKRIRGKGNLPRDPSTVEE